MKHFQSVFLIMLFLFFSCISEKIAPWSDISEFDCVDNRQKDYYVVDSICIASPIIVVAKDGTEFVMSKTVFKKYNGKTAFFYTQPDVYFLESFSLGGLSSYKYQPPNIEYCYDYKAPDFKNKYRLATYHFKKEPDYFILSLINGDYANNIPFDAGRKELKLKNLNFSYYKVVFPICKR